MMITPKQPNKKTKQGETLAFFYILNLVFLANDIFFIGILGK